MLGETLSEQSRSEGFPLTCIFSWARWDWDLDCSENSSVAAVAAAAVAPWMQKKTRNIKFNACTAWKHKNLNNKLNVRIK